MVHPKNKHTSDAETKTAKEANHTENPISPALTVKPQTKPSKCHHTVTCQPEKDWWDKTKPFVEIAGLVVLIFYTYYTAEMYCANRDAANAAAKAATAAEGANKLAQLSSRAWLKLSFDVGTLKAGSADIGTLHFINIGKIPAWDINGAIAIETIAIAGFPELDLKRPRTNFRTSVVFPSDRPEDLLNISIRRQWHLNVRNMRLEGDVPAVDSPVSKEELEQYTNGTIYFVAIARVTYKDSIGEHWTQFCFPFGTDKEATVNTRGCVDYNAIDHD